MPWTSRRVSRPTRTAMMSAGAPRQGHRGAGGFLGVESRGDPGVPEDALPLLLVGAGQADARRDPGGVLDDAAGDIVAPGDAAEDIDEDRPDPGLPLDDVQGLAHSLRGRPAADVQEVGGAPAEMRQEVERAHHQARAVADDGDVAVELDVGQPAGPGLPLEA